MTDDKKKTTSKKKITKKEKTNKTKRKLTDIIKSEKFLLGVFISLLILVIILGIIVVITPKEKKDNIEANIVLPIIKKEEKFDLSVSAPNLLKEGEYIFKVINYKDGKVVNEDIPYRIIIENNIGAILELTEEDKTTNLINNNQNSTIERKSLGTEEEKYIYYHLKITNKREFTKNDFIRLRVET